MESKKKGIIDRLMAKDLARKDKLEEKQKNRLLERDIEQPKFWREFNERLEQCKTANSMQGTKLCKSMADCLSFACARGFLSSTEQGDCQRKITELKTKFDANKKQRKFAFKRSAAPKKRRKSIGKSEEVQIESVPINKKEVAIRVNELIVISKKDSVVNIENLENCCVFITEKCGAVNMASLVNCYVITGPVEGGVHLTDCKNCVFHIICHQVLHVSDLLTFH
eukprot:TRINITY_DN1414_c0_g1_i1.p1 TRINITY_DN1414_c0_g1~~TRINITY_DN1414_c0_g1_i1.p1  ORF type:complete len:224 (-),score=40.18 TRINITY_DN1414_c0_g1_i1:514-1185(-)